MKRRVFIFIFGSPYAIPVTGSTERASGIAVAPDAAPILGVTWVEMRVCAGMAPVARKMMLPRRRANLSVRGEWETELQGDGLDLDALKDTPAGALIKGLNGELRPVFATRVERTAYPVRQGRSRIEAALDHGRVEAGGRSLDVCELELELKTRDLVLRKI